MPRLRARTALHRRPELEGLDQLFLEAGYWVAYRYQADTDRLRLLWEYYQHEIIRDYAARYPGRRPVAYWAWGSGFPEALRCTDDELSRRIGNRFAELQRERWEWLVAAGPLLPGEREAIERERGQGI